MMSWLSIIITLEKNIFSTIYKNLKLEKKQFKNLGKLIKENLKNLFSKKKITIGVVHLQPLPGSPLYDGESI